MPRPARRLQPAPADPSSSAAAVRHRHRIDVETGEEQVHVTLGRRADDEGADRSPSSVPGGFAKFFNRVIDNGLWADLPDAARAVYLPLVRLADGRGPFRARAGLAALMKHSGLSRSSVKRGLKALQDARLIVVVSQGGVGADGVNRSNVYELLVPEANDEAGVGSPADRGSAQRRTPSRAKAEPAPGPAATRPSVRGGTRTGSTADPLLRATTKTPSPDAGGRVAALEEAEDELVGEDADVEASRAATMLGRWGFSPTDATTLVREHGAAATSVAMRDARELDAGGKLRSPSGFIRWRLSELADAPTVSKTAPKPTQAAPKADPETTEAELNLDPYDDATLTALAAEVLERHADNAAMVRLLSAKPPRRSPLMRAEIAALLQGHAAG